MIFLVDVDSSEDDMEALRVVGAAELLSPPGSISRFTTYSSSGSISRFTTYGSSGSLSRFTTYEYGSSGQHRRLYIIVYAQVILYMYCTCMHRTAGLHFTWGFEVCYLMYL